MQELILVVQAILPQQLPLKVPLEDRHNLYLEFGEQAVAVVELLLQEELELILLFLVEILVMVEQEQQHQYQQPQQHMQVGEVVVITGLVVLKVQVEQVVVVQEILVQGSAQQLEQLILEEVVDHLQVHVWRVEVRELAVQV